MLLALAGCRERRIEVLEGDPDVVITEIRPGTGVEAKVGDQITAKYTVWLEDGTELLSISGAKSHTWTLGDETVLIGFDETVVGMRTGGIRRAVIPPDLHYGKQGYADGLVPENTDLIFEVELVSVR